MVTKRWIFIFPNYSHSTSTWLSGKLIRSPFGSRVLSRSSQFSAIQQIPKIDRETLHRKSLFTSSAEKQFFFSLSKYKFFRYTCWLFGREEKAAATVAASISHILSRLLHSLAVCQLFSPCCSRSRSLCACMCILAIYSGHLSISCWLFSLGEFIYVYILLLSRANLRYLLDFTRF